jgi:ankyrin repeat protein
MDLCTAAKTGTVGELRQALNNGADINYRDAVFGRTPLSWAATSGNGEAVELLLAQDGIDLNLKDNGGRTPLSWAVEGRIINTHNMNQNNITRRQVLQSSVSLPAWKGEDVVVKLLLVQNGIDLRLKDNGGRTPLSWAVEKGSKSVVCLLLQKNSIFLNSKDSIGLNSKDNSGRTPLSWAVETRNKGVVGLLLERGNIELNSKDNDVQTPLLLAAKMGDGDIVELLLERDGIELNSQDNGGRTALSWAAEKGRKSNRLFEQNKHIEVVRLLLEKVGIDFNLKDNSGRTALSWAAEKGNTEVVSSLLQKKNNIDQRLKDNDGRSPLSFAAANNHKAVIKLLADNDHLILHTLIQEKRESLVEELLYEKYVKLDAKDPLGKTPMHIAIAGGYVEAAIILMSHGATKINLKDNDGMTPLRLAMRLPDQKKRCCLIELLLEKSALTEDIMVQDWRQAYGKQLSNVVILSGRANGEKSVRFKAEEELDGETPIIETGRRRRL